jgi:general secretion pathway protein A
MYIEYFKLREPPFSLTPDPRYLFMSERHREGLAHLLYGVQQPGGFVLLTGEIGSGKTTLCRSLIKQLPSDTDAAMILNPRLTVIELLATVCDELSIPYPAATGSIKILIDGLNRYLLEAHAQGRRTVLIIDEAQNLHEDVLEQIRLLTNLETTQEKLLQIILIGQPELLVLLSGRKLRQLSQRITARYHLLALSKGETYAYIQHRLLVAGRRDPIFTSRALRLVYRLSGGMPRAINIICDRALLGAYACDKRRIGSAIIRRASRETRGLLPKSKRLRLIWTFGIALFAILAIGGALLLNPIHQRIFHLNGEGVGSSSPAKSTGLDSILQERGEKPETESKEDEGETALPKLDHPLIRSDNDPNHPSSSTGSKPGAFLASAIHDQPKSSSPADRAATNARLVDVLADPSLRGSAASSFISLYALWGAQYTMKPSDLGCKVGKEEGFECLFQSGDWSTLRRFDLPAILELILPNGNRHRATLIGMGKDTATLEVGDRQYTFPLSEINKVWKGSFILVWKPPFSQNKLSYGARGENVKWVRDALDKLEGKAPSSSVSDVFDENLRKRVRAFQRENSLPPDGSVGTATLLKLTLSLEGPNAPSLSHHAR